VNEALFADFVTFARAHVASGDIDPMYPLLRSVYDARGLDEEHRLWFTLLYVTWYHVGSAEQVFRDHPSPRPLPPITVKTGTERRAFRGNTKGSDFVNAVLDSCGGSLEAFARVGTGESAWAFARERLQSIPFGGPWSSYKWADLLKNVHGRALVATDIGVGGGGETAGPVPGMVALTGLDWRRCAQDVDAQRALLARAQDAGVPFTGLDQLETSLCDFNSLMHGRYYVGHDIDDLMTKLDSANAGAIWWEARTRCFDARFLGERGGWFGVRRDLCSRYKLGGEVLT
jgi:hypothetical protein